MTNNNTPNTSDNNNRVSAGEAGQTPQGEAGHTSAGGAGHNAAREAGQTSAGEAGQTPEWEAGEVEPASLGAGSPAPTTPTTAPTPASHAAADSGKLPTGHVVPDSGRLPTGHTVPDSGRLSTSRTATSFTHESSATNAPSATNESSPLARANTAAANTTHHSHPDNTHDAANTTHDANISYNSDPADTHGPAVVPDLPQDLCHLPEDLRDLPEAAPSDTNVINNSDPVSTHGPADVPDLPEDPRVQSEDERDLPEAAPSDTNLTTANRQDVQRRVLTTVFISQALVGTAIAMGVTVSSWLAKLLLGSDAYAGLPVAAFAVGSTSGAWLLGRATQRYGRRVLSTGLTVGGIGAATIVAGGTAHNVPLTFLGMIIYGAAVASGQQLRFAATDLATPTSRGKALTVAMVASTIGALVGPNLVGPAGRIGQTFGVLDLAAPFAATAILFALAAAVITVGFRTDPYLLSCQTPTDNTQAENTQTNLAQAGDAPGDVTPASSAQAGAVRPDKTPAGPAPTGSAQSDGTHPNTALSDGALNRAQTSATVIDADSGASREVAAGQSVACGAGDSTTADPHITSQLTSPADRDNPANTDALTNPSNPTNLAGESNPATPTDPSNPTNLASATSPANPADSANPSNLAGASNPATRADSASPTNLAGASNPAPQTAPSNPTNPPQTLQPVPAKTQHTNQPTTLRSTNWHLVKRAAVATITAQLVMVSVMTMTPIHLQHHNHNLDTVGFVVGLHIFLMYGPSLVTGPLADKLGRNPLAIAGMIVLVAACVVAALSGPSVVWGSVALGLLGIGWNLAFVSGSALIVDAVTPSERPTIQSRVEIGAAIGGTAGGVGSGFVVAASSYPALCTASAIISALAAIYFLAPDTRRTTTTSA